MAPTGSPFFFARLMQTFIFAIDNYKCFPKGSCVHIHMIFPFSSLSKASSME